MSTAILPVEFLCGTHIEDAAIEARRLANLLEVTVHFDFNDVKCGFRPGDDLDLFLGNYRIQQARPFGEIKICYANPIAKGGAS